MDIIEKFPAGIHTVIGTKGVYLSGGEQQRIAIARAMLKNAPVLILDEATAFADPDNEAKVQAAFAQLAKGKTVLMIAHRLSTVANADCIYVVQDGQIVESGTKDELCEQNGLFARMWQELSLIHISAYPSLIVRCFTGFGHGEIINHPALLVSEMEHFLTDGGTERCAEGSGK